MKRPAIFFDRDNTLIVSDGYLGDPAGVKLVDGAADAVARARQYGFVVITVSNQSGVARGLFGEADVQAVNARLDELLRSANPSATIEHHAYCPFHPEAPLEEYRQDSYLRKPKPGMILAAADKLNLDLSRSWVVGDAPRDIEAGQAAGCRTVLFTDPRLKPSEAADKPSEIEPDFTATSLRQAIDIIAREAFLKTRAARPDSATTSNGGQMTTNEPVPQQEPAPAAAVEPQPTAAEAPAPEPEHALPPVATAAPAPAAASAAKPEQPQQSTPRIESLLSEILKEMRRRHEEPVADFSVSRLLAGMVQVLALAVLFFAYLYRDEPSLVALLLFAIALQTLTIALLIMGKQK